MFSWQQLKVLNNYRLKSSHAFKKKSMIIILSHEQTVLPVLNDELLYHLCCKEIQNCAKTHKNTFSDQVSIYSKPNSAK